MPQTLPSSPGLKNSSFDLRFNTQLFQSPLNGNIQRIAQDGSLWTATYTLPPMKRIQYSVWQGFFDSLEGQANTFYGYDPEGTTAQGVATGTPLVNGSSQTGSSLVTDGWTPSQTGILKAGDYFSVNGELKRVTSDTNSDGSGNATISFKPPLRNSPSDDAIITVTNAQVEMILTTPVVRFSTNERGVTPLIQFSSIEVF